MTGTLLDGHRYSNEPVWRPLLQGITFLAGGQCSSAHMPRIPIDMNHKKKKAKNKALQGIQHGRKWGQDYIGGGKSPPDMLPFELGLKEGQEGAHPYLSEYTTNTAGPVRRPGPCEENKKLRLWTKRGAFAVRDMRGSGSRWRPGILSALLPLQGATLRMCAQEVFNWMKV